MFQIYKILFETNLIVIVQWFTIPMVYNVHVQCT